MVNVQYDIKQSKGKVNKVKKMLEVRYNKCKKLGVRMRKRKS